MTGKLTPLETLFVSVCSQLPVAIVLSFIFYSLINNILLAFISVMVVVVPIGWLAVWFADKVKK